MKKYFWIFIFIIFIFQHTKVQAQDTVIHETLQINLNIEMLMSHEYYNGIKVKGIKIKQVEVKKNNYIKNGEVIEGEPNFIYITIEITDSKGEKFELLGGSSLKMGDYSYIMEHD